MRIRALGLTVGLLVAAVPAVVDLPHVGAASPTVETEHARAVISLDPFGLTFEDSSGTAALEELPAPDLRAPSAAANLDPEPGSFDLLPETATYAPLTYVVGVRRDAQHPASLWTGNMLAGVEGGGVHHATRVLETHPLPGSEGLRLEVATTEPGRRLSVLVTPDGPRSLRVSARPVPAVGVVAMGDSFVSGPDEGFHGFGGRHNSLDQRGNAFDSWIEEESFNAGPLQPIPDALDGSNGIGNSGGDTYLFPGGPTAAYYVQNLFISSRPYGFMVNQTERTQWRLAADTDDTWQVAVGAPHLDYTVAVGDHGDAIAELTEISGRHRVAPAWSMGAVLKRNVHQGNETPESYVTKIQDDLAKIEQFMNDPDVDMDVTGYAYEGWAGIEHLDVDGVPAVEWINAALDRLGIKPIGYSRAYVSDDGMFDPEGTFQDAIERNLVAETAAGTPFIGVAVGPAALLDFTKPETVDWWREHRIHKMLGLGFEGFMNDFGEQVLDDMHFDNGETGVSMHNRYPVIFHGVTRGLVEEWRGEHGGPEIFMYTRAGFSGRPGSAAFESANFPGDEQTDWSRANGIAALTTDMLNRAVGGAYGYTTDIGGYIDSFHTDDVGLDDELFARWSQWAALSPFFRLHNSCCDSESGTRMPWSFTAGGFEAWQEASVLHADALPYIRSLWEDAVATGVPMTRPMWLAFPDDPVAAGQDQQWMLGDDVLVAPVVTEGATTRDVYLPAGCWEHVASGDQFTGSATVTVSAPLSGSGSLPYFFRCGTQPF